MTPVTSGGRTRSAIVALAVLLCLQVATASCGDPGSGPGGGEEETISRDTFVSTYVDLRIAALRDTTAAIGAEERERILREHGVTREDLLRFVEIHGQRPAFMRQVWVEVDERIRRARQARDTTSS